MEVTFLLLKHVLHQRAEFWMSLNDGRGLRKVNENGGELACLVDAQLQQESAQLRCFETTLRNDGQRCQGSPSAPCSMEYAARHCCVMSIVEPHYRWVFD